MSRRRLFAAAALVAVVLPLAVTDIRAEQPVLTILGLEQHDLNGDGRPDVTIIDCAFATTHDRITVYDQAGDMAPAADWRQATDFGDDTWVYDIGADGTAQLIVRYGTEEGHAVAWIFDDRDGDGKVAYTVTGSKVTITESPYWTARIAAASDSWFRPNDRLDLNVKIDLDGPIATLDRAPDYYVRDHMPHDGVPDVSFEEVAGSDGVATYAVRSLLAPSPPDWAFGRTWLWSNVGAYRTSESRRAFFPFLQVPVDSHDPASEAVRYFDLPPNLAIDWPKGQVKAVGLEGYPIGLGYHFNSNDYLVRGKLNDVSFESPQAYYDLANRHDAYPTMHVRFFTRPADDSAMWSLPGAAGQPWQAVGYDWNLFNPGTLKWDFKVAVAGNYTINEVVHFPDFDVRTVPYAELPYWVTERDWKLTTLLAKEGPGYPSSEGLYEWMADTGDDPQGNPQRALEARDATFGYMLGAADTTPDKYFETTYPGFRAERHFATSERPNLYFSPVDRKLHLLGAEAGIWTLDNRRIIRSDVVGGGEHLNHWQYFEGSTLRRQLYAGPDVLICADATDVVIRRANVDPSLFETLPPRNPDEWARLKDQLEHNAPTFQPEDFESMLEQFPAPELRVQGATLRGLRETTGGARFVLTLSPGFTVRGVDMLGVSRLSPGSYVVRQDGGDFSVTQLTPPAVSLKVVASSAMALEHAPIRVAAANNGGEDIPAATLELSATSAAGDVTKVGQDAVRLLSGEPIEPEIDWAPPTAGSWLLTARIATSDGATLAEGTLDLTVSAPKQPAAGVLATLNSSFAALPFLVGTILTLALVASATLLLGLNRRR